VNLDLPCALVGELNPYGSNPRFALYHEPAGASGDRLRRMLGLSVDAYRALPKYNLCTGTWNPISAHGRALELRERHRVIIALGVKTRLAFPCSPATWEAREDDRGMLIALPHPSGRNRAWNDPEARQRARELLARHVPDVAWGSEPW
jgi:hypothetical protein